MMDKSVILFTRVSACNARIEAMKAENEVCKYVSFRGLCLLIVKLVLWMRLMKLKDYGESINDRNPNLANFDYYNDYKDTRAWCIINRPEIVEKLDMGFKEYSNKKTLAYINTFGRHN